MAAGMVTSELPLQTLGGQALLAAVVGRRGTDRSVSGAVALGLSAASWAGLVGLYRDARRSREVFEAALTEGLGLDYRDSIGGADSTPDLPLTVRRIAVPSRGARRRYVTGRNIAYGDAGVRNHLDVWRRADLPVDGRAPVILQVHGGAWMLGRKEDQAGPLLSHLAERGWVCVAMNYRLSPRATWPDHIVDVKRVLAWIRATIPEHGGDPSFVAVTGGSAGGHLCALAALSAGDPKFQPAFEEADTSVQAAVPMYGLYDLANRTGAAGRDTVRFLQRFVLKTDPASDEERWMAASPLSYVDAGAPPFFVVHGTNDSLLPVEQARQFTDRLRTVSTSPVVFAELPRAQHAFDFLSSVRVHYLAGAVERFLTFARCAHAADAETGTVPNARFGSGLPN